MLTTKRSDREWTHFTEQDYCITNSHENPHLQVGLLFLCPGCKVLIGIASPPWTIDFINLTARASILHTAPEGCGWHGYLTRGVFSLDCPPI